MAKVWLINHGARVVGLNTKDQSVTLTPGRNQVDAGFWKQLKADVDSGKAPATAALLDEKEAPNGGWVEFGGTVKTSEETATGPAETSNAASTAINADPTLADYSAEEAKELIEDTMNRDQLVAWRLGEEAGKNRKTVLEALDAQIDEVSA